MDIKEIFKKFWFVILIAVLFVCFIVVYSVQMIQNKPIVKEPKQVDGQYVMYSINNENYTADEFYSDLKEKYGMNTAYTAFEKAVVDKAVETTSDMQNIATNNVSYLLQQYGEEGLKAEMKKLGYDEAKDAYDYYIYLQKSVNLRMDYLKAHMDDIIKPFYENNHPKLISHILVKVKDVEQVKDEEGKVVSYNAKPTEEEQAKLDNILNALKEGKSFEEVAKEYSDDTSGKNGGYLGYFDDNNSTYVKVFAEAAKTLKGKETSEVITSEFGYHIIYVNTDDIDELMDNTDFLNAIYDINGYSYYAPILEKAEELNIKVADEDLWNKIMSDVEMTKPQESEEK